MKYAVLLLLFTLPGCSHIPNECDKQHTSSAGSCDRTQQGYKMYDNTANGVSDRSWYTVTTGDRKHK